MPSFPLGVRKVSEILSMHISCSDISLGLNARARRARLLRAMRNNESTSGTLKEFSGCVDGRGISRNLARAALRRAFESVLSIMELKLSLELDSVSTA